MRIRVTPSLVLSIVAVVLSLTGVGYAATQLPRDSVGSAQIKAGAVGSVEVADGSLRPSDFSDAAKSALEGSRGAKGATGAQVPKGETGAQGPAGSDASGATGGLTLKDAAGTVLGTVVGTSGDVLYPSYWVLYGGGRYLYDSNSGTLQVGYSSPYWVYFFAPDCSGQAYGLLDYNFGTDQAALGLPGLQGQARWVAHPAGSATTAIAYKATRTVISFAGHQSYFTDPYIGTCTERNVSSGEEGVALDQVPAPPYSGLLPLSVG